MGTSTLPTDVKRSVSRIARATTALGVVGLAAMCLVPWIPVWPCMLFGHFRLQLVEVGVVVVLVAGALRMRGYFDAALIATLLHAVPVAADLIAVPSKGPRDGVAVRVLLLNVHTSSSSFERVRELIAAEDPDVIGLVEVDERWLAALAPALSGYPGRIEHPRSDNFGVALYARGSVAGAAQFLASSLPSVVAEVALRDARFTVIVNHPLPPVNAVALDEQLRHFDAVAAQVRATAGPMIVMGDFNATPWSDPFRRLREGSGLCDSRAGFGVQATFPASSSLLRIPIDHVLVSCSVGVTARRIGRDVGSDHLPVIVDVRVPR